MVVLTSEIFIMEANQKVTDEIRKAIKKKLAEFDAFVDDELPEYIMILIANKRSREQINKHLSLFLGNDTVSFTLWLENLLKSLKATPKGYETLPVTQKESVSKSENNVKSNDDCDVLNCDLNEQEDELSCEDNSNSFSSKESSENSILDSKTVKNPLSVPETRSNIKVETSTKTEHKVQKTKNISQLTDTVPLSTVAAFDKKVPFPVSEYNPDKPSIAGNVSSVVRMPRGRNNGTTALQTNKLLLRAVDDATKSVLNGKNINDYYKPTPIKVLASKTNTNKPALSNAVLMNNNPKINTSQQLNVPLQLPKYTFHPEFDDLGESSKDSSDQEDVESAHSRTICLTSTPRPSINNHNSRTRPFDENQYSVIERDEENTMQPHFFVTLEGVNLHSLKRKHVEDDPVESMEEDENIEEHLISEEVEDTSVPEKKLKLNERCKYWPSCKNNDQCIYYHPSIPCKCFPDCKFGDKCLYIHPKCKFDALCSRKDCPYTHVSKRKLSSLTLPVKMPPMKFKMSKTVCKFYPKCTSRKCPFIHPKLCRYGTDCRSPTCVYSHFKIPSRNQLKWQA